MLKQIVFSNFVQFKKFRVIAIRKKRFRPQPRREDLHKINEKIDSPKVRLIGDNIDTDVYPTKEALQKARELELDLVEISPKAVPPVCKIIDYKKFVYEQKKKQKELKSKSVKIVVKEIRFGPNTDDHDYEFKKNHAISFLKEGAKLKAYVFFRGRQIAFTEEGQILLLRLAQDIEEFGKVDQMPKLEGKRMIMLVSPKKVKKK